MPESAHVSVARLVLMIQGLRALLYGFSAVLLGSVLAAAGLSAVAAGAVFTATLVGMAGGSLVVGRFADDIGARRLYCALFIVLAAAGTLIALTSSLPLLILAALTGTISTDANESGPITSLEQAMLSGVDPVVRARVFGRYNAVAYFGGSLGSLLAGAPGAVRSLIPSVPVDQRWLLAMPVIALGCLVLALRLPPDVSRQLRKLGQRGLSRSKRNVRRLAALFSLDAFGGGLVVQSFIVFWFARRFGTSVELMATVFFAVGVLQALSALMAPRIAARAGLLYTMVFTHLPSNVLLALVPLMPTLPLAIVLLLLRSALSQMDVPARQAYLAALVDPPERVAAAAYTNSARYASRPFGPLIAGSLMQGTALAAPFVVAGAVKSVYDIAVLALFRRVSVSVTATAKHAT